MRDLAQDSGEYFSALSNVHNLTLCHITAEHISEEDFRTCFSAFRETLTCLSPVNSSTPFSAFVALLDYFPYITSLQLYSLELKPDEGSVPSLTRPLQGKIHLWDVGTDYLEFFNRFAKLELE